MSGASGPTVTLQMPFSPFVIGCGLPSSSPLAITDVAFGARYRNVIVWSAPTSGDTRPAPAAATPAARGRLRRGHRRHQHHRQSKNPFPSYHQSTSYLDRIAHRQVLSYWSETPPGGDSLTGSWRQFEGERREGLTPQR